MEWFGSFQREVSQMYRLRHPNLVQMHGIMLAPLRIVLEFCASGDLLGVLKRRQIKGRPIKMRLALDIANGMKFLHNLDPPFAHRELRSSNVLLISISAAAKDAVAKVKLADSSLTKASNTTPTWQWTAPEV
jgi:serine/threonine protein kinase